MEGRGRNGARAEVKLASAPAVHRDHPENRPDPGRHAERRGAPERPRPRFPTPPEQDSGHGRRHDHGFLREQAQDERSRRGGSTPGGEKHE